MPLQAAGAVRMALRGVRQCDAARRSRADATAMPLLQAAGAVWMALSVGIGALYAAYGPAAL